MMSLKPVLARLALGETMTEEEAEAAFGIIMEGEATPAQIAAMLMAMRVRGETVAEMTGAVRAMRARMTPIEAPAGAIDLVGTGGDGVGTLNISTAAAFVVAGCGVPVAKHGNKALSSKSGASDVLGALGINLEQPIPQLAEVLRKVGMVFLAAPRHHAALRHAAGPRVELGTRTIFNLVGPLTSPARVTRQMTGAFAPQWLRPMAETLARTGTEHAWLVHGQGLDELTLSGPGDVVEVKDGAIRAFSITPADAGLPGAPMESLLGGSAAENAEALIALLRGVRSPYRDCVVLNAAAALVVAGATTDLPEAARRAERAIDEGAAFQVLEHLRAATNPT
jgi:anthranilate phosphoribosyltransferase